MYARISKLVIMQMKADGFLYDLMCLIGDFKPVFSELQPVAWAQWVYLQIISVPHNANG